MTHLLTFGSNGQLNVSRTNSYGTELLGTTQSGSWRLQHPTVWLSFDNLNVELVLDSDSWMKPKGASSQIRMSAFLVSKQAAGPRSYLTLAHPNFSMLRAGGTVYGETIETQFYRVQVRLPEMQVVCSDFTFCTSENAAAYLIGNGATQLPCQCHMPREYCLLTGGSSRTDYSHMVTTLFRKLRMTFICGCAALRICAWQLQ